MKIAIICNITGIPEKDAKHSGFHFGIAFKQLGDVVDFYHWQYQNEIPDGYDFYLCVDSSESYEIQPRLRPLIVYNGDTHMPQGLDRDYVRSKNADLVFNGNLENGVNLIRLVGLKSIWLPLGFDSRFDFGDEEIENKDIDIAMVGHPNSQQRVDLWSFLSQYYPNSMIGDIDAREAYRRAKIVVNQPTEPWNNIYNNRLLEGMAAGCVVLQKELSIKSHELLFKPDQDFIYWHDFDDLKIKIDTILRSYGDYRSRALEVRKNIIKSYSYRNLCQIIKNYFLNWKNGAI